MAALEDQSTPGLVVFIPESQASPGWTLWGEPVKLIFGADETPELGVQEVEAEVGFLETTTASDKITVSVEVYNYGGAGLHPDGERRGAGPGGRAGAGARRG